MTNKVQKIRKEVEQLMYGFNLEADIASCEDTETEKLANIKYQLCKKILEYINTMQEEPVSEELEEEITKCYESRIDLMMTRKQFGEIIHHFTEWQKEQIKKAMDLGEPPYLISVEQAYYRTLKLLEE